MCFVGNRDKLHKLLGSYFRRWVAKKENKNRTQLFPGNIDTFVHSQKRPQRVIYNSETEPSSSPKTLYRGFHFNGARVNEAWL